MSKQQNTKYIASNFFFLITLDYLLCVDSRNWGSEDGLAFEAKGGTWSSKRTCISPFKFCRWDTNRSQRLQIHQYSFGHQL